MSSQFVRPGLIGRGVRLLLGMGLITTLLLTSPAELADPDGLFWILVAYTIWGCAHLVNIGLQRGDGNRLRAGFLTLVGVSLGLDLALYRRLWAPPGAWTLYVGVVAVIGAQSISYVLAAILATPGCEWRALPHLISRLHGGPLKHAYPCPLGLHRLDEWEYRRQHASREDQR